MEKMSSIELKPCPCCGGSAEIKKQNIYNTVGFRVCCTNCHISTSVIFTGHPAAIAEVWNKRIVADSEKAGRSTIQCGKCRYIRTSKDHVHWCGYASGLDCDCDRKLSNFCSYFRPREVGVSRMTNADRIRAMTDDELAAIIACHNEVELAEIECDQSDNCNCGECCLSWLRSPTNANKC